MKLKLILCLSFLLFGLSALFSAENTPVTVAQDGSGDFKTIQEAITSCRPFQEYEKVIYIKNGVYKEKILIDSFYINLKLVGESVEKTIITYGDHAGMPGIGTFNSYTIKVTGNRISLENLTIENSAGEVGQAVALHVEGDQCIFRNCRILGTQDTVYAAGQKSRQYFADCFISGTTDFIFGAATALFDNCTSLSRRNSFITAPSTPKSNRFGYVFRKCKLTGEPGVDKVYLGRPWRDYARVVFLDCEMGVHILPEGWHNWDQSAREKTSFYAESGSTGPGAKPGKRVNWSHQLNKKEAKQYELKNIFQEVENMWIPASAKK